MPTRAPTPRRWAAISGLAVCATLVVAACGDSVTQLTTDDVVELRVSPDSAAVGVGQTLQLRAIPLDSTGALVASESASWSSTAEGVASVDESGLVTGVSVGDAEIVATVGIVETRARISVVPPPLIVFTPDTVSFSAVAGDPDPEPDTVAVTNGGTLALVGLSLDSISYSAGADDWLAAQLLATSAPTDLEVEPMLAGVTTAGTYSAVVWVSGIDAENAPAPLVVTLTISAAAATTVAVASGDGQSAAVGTAVADPPAVLVTDDFGNPVSGVAVAFTVESGGGTVTGGSVQTNASGMAAVGSWTLGTTTGDNTLRATIGGTTSVDFSATAVAGSPAALELADGDGQSAVAGTAVAIAPSVVVRDGFGNGVPGTEVLFEVVQGGGSVSGSPASSTVDGTATIGSWTLGPTAGTNALIATVTGVPDTISFDANGIAGAAATLSMESGDAQSDTIGATLGAPYAVRVADANGNGVSGVTVTWGVTAGGGSIGNLSTSGSNGVAVARHTLGNATGAQTATASVSGLTGSPVVFSSTAVAGAPVGVAVLDGDGQTAEVASALLTPPSVLVTDRAGNPTAGISVAFAVTGGGGSVAGTPATTDPSGVARVGSWTLGPTAGQNALSATVSGLTPATFTATGVAAAAAQLQVGDGDNQSAVAGSAVSVPPSVIVRDAFGNGVEGTTVDFQVLTGDGSVTGAAAVSDAAGVARVGSWTLGASAGSNTLLATAAGVPDSVTFNATAISGAAESMSLEAGDAQTDTVGATLATAYAVRVVDTNANGVQGVTVTWTVTGGGGSITSSSVTDANGVATASRTLGMTVGAQTATGSVGGLTGSPVTFTATATAGAPANASVNAGNGQSATVGTAVAVAPSVRVTDQFGNAVSGVGVAFAVTSGGGSVTGAAPTTDAAGIARVGSWTLGTTAGANGLSATPTGLASVPFAATGTADAAAQLLLSAGDGQTATAGSPVAVEPAVEVRDQFGNPVQGETVTFAVTGGGGSVTGATPTSGSNGVASVGSWTLGTSAGTNTLSASAAGVAGTVDFTATGVAGAAASMALAGGDAQTDTVRATLATPYSVRVDDANGNPVQGTTVSWSVTGGGGSITASSITDASGIATATRTLGTGAGTQTAIGSVGGLVGSPVSFTATATAGAPTQMTVSAGQGQTATVNTFVAVDPSVLVRDQFGNPVQGENVTFAVTGGGGAVVPTTPIATGANGIATATSWRMGTTAGTNNNTLSATAASAGITGSPATFTASATAGSPNSISVTSGNGQTAVTGGAVGNPPTVTVRDQFNNPVSGATVTFSASGGGSAGSSSVSTNVNGRASTTWTVSTTGHVLQNDGTYPNTLTAAVQGTALSTQFGGDAIYSWVTHVNPTWAASTCLSCHVGAGTSGLALDGSAAANYASLVNVVPVCDGSLGTNYRRISPVGGVVAASDYSILMRMVDPNGAGQIGLCRDSGHTTPLSAAQLEIIRAWIRNSAPNN